MAAGKWVWGGGVAASCVLAAVCVLVCLVGCQGQPEQARLTVYAASSLTDVGRALEAGFEAANPGVDVVMVFAGSQTLRLQLEQGAAADLFISANEDHVDALEAGNLASSRQVLAHSALVLVVPRDNPARIQSFKDLPSAARLVLGTEQVPVGRYAKQVIGRAGQRWGADWSERVERAVVSREANVRLVRAKVAMGEADAAVVYRTDALGQPGLLSIPIPESLGVRARYVQTRLSGAKRPELAARWSGFVRSEAGRRLWRQHGFE